MMAFWIYPFGSIYTLRLRYTTRTLKSIHSVHAFISSRTFMKIISSNFQARTATLPSMSRRVCTSGLNYCGQNLRTLVRFAFLSYLRSPSEVGVRYVSNPMSSLGAFIVCAVPARFLVHVNYLNSLSQADMALTCDPRWTAADRVAAPTLPMSYSNASTSLTASKP